MHSEIWLQNTHDIPSNFFLKHVTLVEKMKYGLLRYLALFGIEKSLISFPQLSIYWGLTRAS